jgi:glycosyltransferase involved in cell wall biosynthesis
MSGLFVQKHAEAVGLFADVRVLYVHADENIRTFEIEERKLANIIETIIYFPNPKDSFFRRSFKAYNYLKAYNKGFKHIKSQGFIPEIIHANILTRTGFIAYLYKLCKGTPYIITEHWTRYLPDRNAYNGIIRKFITKKVVKKAEAILPVSTMLKEAMLTHNLHNNQYIVVDNVIDPAFFKTYLLTNRIKKRIILVSCFLETAKNVSGILRAVLELSRQRDDFELIIIGSGIDYHQMKEYAATIGLVNETVRFLGEKTSQEVAEWIYNSDFFVLFSNYETAGIVITESLALGKPVLTTRVGIAEDYINKKTGIIIESHDENALLEKLNYMLDNFQSYNSKTIQDTVRNRCSYESVGKKINKIYKQVLDSKS